MSADTKIQTNMNYRLDAAVVYVEIFTWTIFRELAPKTGKLNIHGF